MLTVSQAGSEHAPAPSTPARFSDRLSHQLELFLGVSVLLLIPCFWHAHIEAGDLGSHVYNAWLAQLIEQGKAPGLYVVPQWNNVLLDLLLLNFSKMFGFALAEKFAASLCVLVFFWGVFLLMWAISAQPPWFLTPLLAMLAYGLIFHMGFLNYYMSVGLCGIALSLLWPGRRNGVIVALLIAPVILLAHPLGFALFWGIGSYRLIWQRVPDKWKWILPVGALLVCFAARWYVSNHPDYEVQWREVPLWRITGLDQFHVFGERYGYVTRAVALLAVLITVVAAIRSRQGREFWKERRLALELYLVAFCVTAMLPENVHTDPTAGWIGEIATRLTLIIGIFGLCWLASLPPQRWQLAACAAVACLFFVFIYQDTSFLNRLEANAEQVTRRLPFGTRVAATVYPPIDFRARYLHIPDRACIGHCFLVCNYEPSTKQFRIRVHEGSPVVTASVDDSEDMQSGTYDVQEEDLPLKQLYQCDGRDLTAICIRDLAEDEKNGAVGYHPFPLPDSSDTPAVSAAPPPGKP
jgi:hypothetical protein